MISDDNLNIDQTDFALLLENTLDAVVGVDDNNKVFFWNRNAEKIFGWAKAEILGRDLSEFVVPARFQAGHSAGMRRFVETGVAKIQNQRIEIPGLHRDGHEFLMELTVSSVKADGRYRFYSFMRDISARAEADETLKESQSQFKNLANSIPQLAWMTDENGSIFWYNDRWYEYTGTTFEEMQGWGWEKVHNPALLPKMLPIWKRALATGEAWEDVFQLKSKHGEYRWFLSRAHPIKDSHGKVVRWFGTNTDINDVREAEEKLRLALEGAQMGTWTLKFPENILTGDDRFKRMHGLSDQDVDISAATGERIHVDDLPGITAALATAVEKRTPYVCEYRMKTSDGSYRWVYARGETLFNSSGQPESISGVTFDIDNRKQMEMQLVAAKDEAERANELKSAFLANMSHEIRTPLGAMMGFADLLKDPGLTATERQSFTNILSRNGESLSVIINDILDLSKVEAGHLTLEYTDTYPDQIGADVVSLLRVKANEKDLVLEYSHDETSPLSIVSDPTRVRQILLNLVGNAIKFTQFGSVSLRSFACKSERGRDALCFEVKDSGIGIAKDQQENVFEMFVQADGSMTRRFGGTGLGLALSRHLARAMGGDVVLTDSEAGVGSTFLVKIEDQHEKRDELAAAGTRISKHEAELPETAVKGAKILVVDDAPDNQQLIWRYLTKHGAVVESAENGLLGYRAALSGDHDLVLMDIQMPVMDGYAATQKLREAGYRKPIIALTAHAMSEVRRKALNVGYSDHLTKPINPQELIGTIARYLRE